MGGSCRALGSSIGSHRPNHDRGFSAALSCKNDAVSMQTDMRQFVSDTFRLFLGRFGTGRPPRESASGFEQLFKRTDNSFGLKTVYEAAGATFFGLYA